MTQQEYDYHRNLRSSNKPIIEKESGFWDLSKDRFSKSAVGQLLRYGNAEDRKETTYGTSKGSLGGFFNAPKRLTIDGNTFNTNNKIINDMNDDELKVFEQKNFIPSEDESDRWLYKLKHKQTGAVKVGVAKDGTKDRYELDSDFENWEVLYDAPTKNADNIEKQYHGAKVSRDNQKFRLGLAKDASLDSGGSEIYNVGEQRIKNTENILYQLTGKEDKSESALTGSMKFYRKAEPYLNAVGVDTGGLTPREINKKMVERLSNFNMNMVDMGLEVDRLRQMSPELASNFAEMVQAYDETDVDMNQVGRGLWALTTDPTTILGLGSVGSGFVAKSAAQKGIKAGVSSYIKQQAGIGAVEGAGYAALDSTLKQKAQVYGGKKDKVDLKEVAAMAAMGAGLGAAAGGGLAKLLGGGTDIAEKAIVKKVINAETPDERDLIIHDLRQSGTSEDIAFADKLQTSIDNATGKNRIDLNGLKPVKQTNTRTSTQRLQHGVQKQGQPQGQEPIVIGEKSKLDIYTPSIEDLELQLTESTKMNTPQSKIKANQVQEELTKIAKAEEQTKRNKLQNEMDEANENKLFEVVNPREGDIPLKGFENIPVTKTPFIQRTKSTISGRQGQGADNTILNTQAEKANTATIKQHTNQPEKVSNVNSWVDGNMKIFENDIRAKNKMGTTENKFKGAQNKTEEEIQSTLYKKKTQFLKRIIARNKDKDIISTAKNELKIHQDRKLKFNTPSKEDIKLGEQQFSTQYKAKQQMSEQSNTDYETLMKRSYKTMKDSREGKEEGFSIDNIDSIEGQRALFNNIKSQLSQVKFAKSYEKLEKLVVGKGEKFDIDNIPDSIQSGNKELIDDVMHYMQAKKDLADFNNGIITASELRHRAKYRLDSEFEFDDIKKIQGESNSIEDINLARERRNESYRKIGVKVQDSPFIPEKDKTTSGEWEPSKDISKATIGKRNAASEALDSYEFNREQGKSHMESIPLKSTKGQSVGRKMFSESFLAKFNKGMISKEELVDLYAPNVADHLIKDEKKRLTKYYNERINNSLSPKIKWTQKPNTVVFQDDSFDAINSFIQNFGVLTRDKDIFESFGNIREDIGAYMEEELDVSLPKVKTDEGKWKTWKDIIKPLFMTKSYSQGDKGLIENLARDNVNAKTGKNWTIEEAREFFNKYEKAENDLFPQLGIFREEAANAITNGKIKEVTWTLPDSTRIIVDMTKMKEGTFQFKGQEKTVNYSDETPDTFAKKLLPMIIQSMDSYSARQANKKFGMSTNHDEFKMPTMSGKDIQESYNQSLDELLQSNILEQITSQLGIKSDIGLDKTLKTEHIKASKTLEQEHFADMPVNIKVRKREQSEMSPEEAMLDFAVRNNYRQTPLKSLTTLITTEATRNSALHIPTRGQDVLERQTSLAMNNAFYSNTNSVKASTKLSPNEEKTWNKMQKELFDELRAKLEQSPHKLVRDNLKGERRFFTKQGELIANKNNKMISELIQEQVEKRIKLEKQLTKQEKIIIEESKKAHKQWEKGTYRWKPAEMNEEQIVQTKFVFEAREGKPVNMSTEIQELTDKVNQTIIINEVKNEAKIKKKGYTWSYLKTQFNPDEARKEFNKLYNIKAKSEKVVNYNAEGIKKELQSLMKDHDEKEWYDMTIKTNVQLVMNMNKNLADEYWNMFPNLTSDKLAIQMISAASRSYGDNSLKFGAYLNNGHVMAKELNLNPEHYGPILTKLATIKAMNDKVGAWDFLALNRHTEAFDMGMKIQQQTIMLSKRSFQDNPEKFIDGYALEGYDGYHQIDESGQLRYNAEQKITEGAIVGASEAEVMGQLTVKMKSISSMEDFKGIQKAIDYAEANTLKIQNKGFFRIQQTGEKRDLAGRVQSYSDAIVNTMAATQMKWAHRQVAKDQLKMVVDDESLIFSSVAKAGFVEITETQQKGIIKSLQGTVKFVNEDYAERLFNRAEVRMFNAGKDTALANQRLKVADRLWKDFFTNAKQNVVLKNTSSMKNAFLGGIMLNSMIGTSPIKMVKYYTEAVTQTREIKKLRTRRAKLKARGRGTASIDKELAKFELYNMEQAGLSINQLDGVRGKSSFLTHMLSEQTGGRLDKTFGTKFIQSKVDSVVNTAALNQGTYLGDKITQTFSMIDTQSRYSAARAFMDKNPNLSIEDAVFKANTLYGDMDQMAPALVEAVDKYGGVLFAQWAINVAPGIMRITKDNPKKSLAIMLAIYGVQVETDTNLESMNPATAMIDFADPTKSLDYLIDGMNDGFGDASIKRMTSYLIPGILRDADKMATEVGQETIFSGKKYKSYNPLFKDRLKKPKVKKDGTSRPDRRGISSQALDALLDNNK